MVIPNALVELNPSSFGRPSDAAQANGTGTHAERLVDQTRLALKTAADRLLNKQRPDGHWCAELEGDTILESEYAILLAFLGRLGDARIKNALTISSVSNNRMVAGASIPADRSKSVAVSKLT